MKAIPEAVHLEQQRDLDDDPGYGIEQLEIIGWTSVSTAKSNPEPGLFCLRALRDILSRWSAEATTKRATDKAPIVYVDNVFEQLLGTFEVFAVVASESMQPQTASEFFRSFTLMFDRLPKDAKPRAEDLIRRTLSALGEHVLTLELSTALNELSSTLEAAGRHETANEVRAAREKLAASVGRLGSRATRASHPK